MNRVSPPRQDFAAEPQGGALTSSPHDLRRRMVEGELPGCQASVIEQLLVGARRAGSSQQWRQQLNTPCSRKFTRVLGFRVQGLGCRVISSIVCVWLST